MKERIGFLCRCHGWEVAYEEALGKLRPDILCRKNGVYIAVECQCSKMSLEEFVERNRNYDKMGLLVLWVFGEKYLRSAQIFIEWTRKRWREPYSYESQFFLYREEYSYQIQRISLVEKTIFENESVIWYFDGVDFYYATWKPRYRSKTLGWYDLRQISFRVVSKYLEKFYGHLVTGGAALVLKKLSKPQFLSVEEVPQGSIVTVAEEPYIVPAEQTKWGKERGRVVVQLGNGEERSWTMNNTTWDALIEAFGAEPTAWLGKKIQIDIQQMNIRGEAKQVIFGKPYVETPKQVGL